MGVQDLVAAAMKSPRIMQAVKDICLPLAEAVLAELYPYIYFSLILVTMSFILQIAVAGLIIKYTSRLTKNPEAC